MSEQARHTPGPWGFDAENNYITLHEAPIFRVFRADDFPCIEDEDRATADLEYLTYAQVAVMLLNVVATTSESSVGAAISAEVARLAKASGAPA